MDGGYVLRSKSDMTKYLAVPSSTASTSVTVETVSESGAAVQMHLDDFGCFRRLLCKKRI